MKSADFAGGVSARASKSFVVLSGKQLTLSSGTSIPFDSDLIKYAVPMSYKILNLDTGTAVSFDGYVIKRNIHLSNKSPSLSGGSSLDIEVNTSTFGYRTLMMSQSVFYPIDVSRVYFIDGNKIKSFFIK
jgi:hypothetical protein